MNRKEIKEKLNNHPLFQMSDEERKKLIEKDVDNKYRDEILLLVYAMDGSKLDYNIYYEGKDNNLETGRDIKINTKNPLMDENTFLLDYDRVASLEAVSRALKSFSNKKGAQFYTYYRRIYDNIRIDYYLKEEPIKVSRTVYKLICDARSLHASMNANYYTEEEAVEKMKKESNYEDPIRQEYLEKMKKKTEYACLNEQEILDIMRDDPKYKKHSESTFKLVERYMKSGGVLIISDRVKTDDSDEEVSLIENMEDVTQTEMMYKSTEKKGEEIKEVMERLYRWYLGLSRANHRAILALNATNTMVKELKTEDGKKFYEEEPAGNIDIYDVLVEDDGEFMRKIFRYDYAESTVNPGPESAKTLFGIYYNKVREGVEYNDKEVADFAGVKASSYSRTMKTIREKLVATSQDD